MADFTSKASGNWDTEGQTTWNEAGHPTGADTVTIQDTHTVTLDSATACTTLTINTGGILTDVTNNVGITVSGITGVSGTLTCGTAAMSFGSGVTAQYALEVDGGGTVTGGTGNWTVGSLQCQMDTSTLTMPSGICTIDSCRTAAYGLIVISGATFAHNDGTIVFTGISADMWVDSAAHSLYKLRINSGNTHRLQRNMVIANDLNVLNGTLSTHNSNYTLTVSGYTSITGTFDGNASTVTHTKNVTINSGGVYTASSGTTNLNNDITNSGTFTHSNGTVVMTGTDQCLINSMTFWHFTKSVTTARSLEFTQGETFTFGGNVTLEGVSGQLLTIKSLSTGVVFNFVVSAGAVKTSLNYLSVKDSDASGSDATHKPIAPTNSVDVSGNTDWFSAGEGSPALILCV